MVTFHKIDDATTRVAVQMDFVPEGLKEKLGDMLGVPERRVKGDLDGSRSSSSRAVRKPARGAARFPAKGDRRLQGVRSR